MEAQLAETKATLAAIQKKVRRKKKEWLREQDREQWLREQDREPKTKPWSSA